MSKSIIKVSQYFTNYEVDKDSVSPRPQYKIISAIKPTAEELATELIQAVESKNLTVIQVIKYNTSTKDFEGRHFVNVSLTLLVE